jgi:hypothetical protein
LELGKLCLGDLDVFSGNPRQQRGISAPDLRSTILVGNVDVLPTFTGRAGTGKTTVARALLDGIERVEGESSMLLLAPTGKARNHDNKSS